ncbi:MAG: hypothetical protein VYB22_02305 [Pseudomonadota bacterium]|nr:hypothetical protein [Pseudomonadota bacterium]
MSLFRILLPVMLGFLCLFSAAQAAPDNDDLIGTWYSEKKEQGETMKWLTRRMQDQGYASLFLVCNGENFSWVRKEIGVWQIEADKLVETAISIEDMNGKKQAQEITTYTNLALNDDSLSYDKINSDKSFSFQRVADGFQISCQKQ